MSKLDFEHQEYFNDGGFWSYPGKIREILGKTKDEIIKVEELYPYLIPYLEKYTYEIKLNLVFCDGYNIFSLGESTFSKNLLTYLTSINCYLKDKDKIKGIGTYLLGTTLLIMPEAKITFYPLSDVLGFYEKSLSKLKKLGIIKDFDISEEEIIVLKNLKKQK